MYINVSSDILNSLLNEKVVEGYFLREIITGGTHGSNVILIFEHENKTWRATGTLFLEVDNRVIGVFKERCKQVKKTPVISYVWQEE